MSYLWGGEISYFEKGDPFRKNSSLPLGHRLFSAWVKPAKAFKAESEPWENRLTAGVWTQEHSSGGSGRAGRAQGATEPS